MNPLRKYTKYLLKPLELHDWFCSLSATLIVISSATAGLDGFEPPQMPSTFATSLLLLATVICLTANRTVWVGLALTDTLLFCMCWAFLPAYASWTLVLPVGVVAWLISYCITWGTLVSVCVMICFEAVVWVASGFFGCIGVGILIGLVGLYLRWRASRAKVDPTIHNPSV